ncbi:MAG: hypothetical protein E7618_01550 [Ruminococcaceae bacterium]|nr:hypothetical protein [Oscillospiraceae bacterium]
MFCPYPKWVGKLCILCLVLCLTIHLLPLSAAAAETTVIGKIEFDSLAEAGSYIADASSYYVSGSGVDNSGALCLRGASGNHVIVALEGITILPNVEYTVSYYIRMDAKAAIVAPHDSGAKAFFRFGTNDDTRFGDANDGSGDWVYIQGTLVTTIETDKVQFCYLNSITGTDILIDQLTISTSDPNYAPPEERYHREYTAKTVYQHDSFTFESQQAVDAWSGRANTEYRPGAGLNGSGAMALLANGNTQIFALSVQSLQLTTGLYQLGFSYRVDKSVNLVRINKSTGARLFIRADYDDYTRIGMPSNHAGEWQTVSMAIPLINPGELQLVLSGLPQGTEVLIDNVVLNRIDTAAHAVEDNFKPVTPILPEGILFEGSNASLSAGNTAPKPTAAEPSVEQASSLASLLIAAASAILVLIPVIGIPVAKKSRRENHHEA